MSKPDHFVAVFGGAVSGAEAAWQLAERGVRVAVFDQNALPYGKIEDGLPKWHVKLRDKEEAKINEKLTHPLVTFVPLTRLGRDVDFEDVARNWGFSAVVLAIGAWKDRPLPVEGVDAFIGRGFYYQNPFIYWFNHFHEPDFKGENCTIADGAIIVGGGLASIDVAKALMMLNVQKALEERGHKVDLFTLDRSIARVLEGLGLTLEDLDLKGCTLYYRRRIKDMPLTPMDTSTPELLAKAERVREKVLDNARSKYLFRVEPLHVPVDKVVEGERLAGLVFQRTEVVDGRVKPLPGTEYEVRAPLTISSIGSIPEPIAGIPMKYQTYDVDEENCCRIRGFQHVFAVGNAVTGRGNINESLKHGREVSQSIYENWLQWDEDGHRAVFEAAREAASEDVMRIAEKIQKAPPLSAAAFEALEERIRQRQEAVGYHGDYEQWVREHLPVRLETLIGADH